ncbi:MAG: HD domain-containing protein [Candidatus Hodarchaeales archaeon]
MDFKTEKVFQYAKQQASKHPTHDWCHTLRVWAIAQKIALNETQSVNFDILELAVYLHDNARQEEEDSNGSVDHSLLGSKKAKDLLQTLNYPENTVNEVCHCIESHRFRKNKKNHHPLSIEAKILFDADKLDISVIPRSTSRV